MDRNDQNAIESLFGKLAEVERQATPRDGEAEAYIRDQIARQPGAPYYMAQTIIVQEQALNSAQRRIEELEEELGSRQSSGGLFSGMFGDRNQPRRSGSVPRVGRSGASSGYDQQRQGGGFLAGAAQTAMGVAGGVLLGSAIGGMFAGGAEAQEADAGAQEADAGVDDAGFDGGGDFGGIDL